LQKPDFKSELKKDKNDEIAQKMICKIKGAFILFEGGKY
jgi:hypothetical protein